MFAIFDRFNTRTCLASIGSSTVCELSCICTVLDILRWLAVSSYRNNSRFWLHNDSMVVSKLRLEPNDFGNILRVVLPDIGVFIIAVTVYGACRKLCPAPEDPCTLSPNLSVVSSNSHFFFVTSFYDFTLKAVIDFSFKWLCRLFSLDFYVSVYEFVH